MNYKLFMLILSAIGSSKADVDDHTLVTLPEGSIRGKELHSSNDKLYYAFQEIPFAAPPAGQLRFQALAVPRPWKGILNTTENTKICYQNGIVNPLPELIESEDCLYLNVYTPNKPGDPSNTPLPVLVWIHGGSFVSGAGAFQLYNPGLFIDYDIVVVTINYRLGPLGFLTTEDEIIPGNLGLRDQHFAIQWVKKNINLFGGDSEKITISGESAGATCVGLQLLSSRNKELFRAAILQSGTALCHWSHQDYARFYAFKLGKSFYSNFTSNDSKELLKLLQNVPVADINNNTITTDIGKETGVVEGQGVIWLPVIEDASLENAFLTGPFHEDVRTGNMNQVPVLLGFNSLELLFFTYFDPLMPGSLSKYFDSNVTNLIRNQFNMAEADKISAGTKIKQIYTTGTFENDNGSVLKFYSDGLYTTPMTRHAKLQSNYTDVYLYQFSYKGEMGGLNGFEIAGVNGVGHTEDLAYLWDFHYITNKTSNEPDDLVTRDRLLTMWSNFVKYLNPTPEEDTLLGNVIWKKVSTDNLLYLNINNNLTMETNPKEYLKWERIIDTYAIPPLVNY